MTPERRKELSDQAKARWAARKAGDTSFTSETFKRAVIDAKEVNKVEPLTVQQNISVSPMTPEEKAIFSRVASESNFPTVDQYSTADFSLSEDPFKLPEPAMKLQKEKKFQFRWIERKPERLDAVKNAQEVRRWLPVNSTQPVAGAFDRHIDGSTGAVHLLDQILVWKPYWLFEKEQALEVRLAGGLNDISAKDGQEKNDLRLAASKRKASESRTRIEVSGDDIQYTGEVEATGGEYEAGSESDMAVNE